MWIESHQGLARHPKLKQLARRLGTTPRDAIGVLHLLWWWALDYAQDGDLTRHDPDDVADACWWDGDPAALLGALAAAGFVDADGRIHDWHVYAGKLIDRRRADAERGLMWRNGTRAAAIRRDGLVCGICGHPVPPEDVHVDHIVPVSKGGKSVLDNLRVTHSFCNVSRGNRDGGR